MKEIAVETITKTIEQLCVKACCDLGDDITGALALALKSERNLLAKEILSQLLENSALAKEKCLPCCQDTGLTVVFAYIGQDVHISGGGLFKAVNAGIRAAYEANCFRKSVADPLTRLNTGDNTPCVLHTQVVEGDALKLVVAPKGFGSENKSALKMLQPSDGIAGVEDFIVDCVIKAGSDPCPPVILGVGIGGAMEKCALLAKEQLLRGAAKPSADVEIAALEARLLKRINALGIGPMGLGGDTTCLGVHIAKYPTHIAGLPVAVNVQCHAARHKEAVL